MLDNIRKTERSGQNNLADFKRWLMSVLVQDITDQKGEPLCAFPYNGIRTLDGEIKPDVDLLFLENELGEEDYVWFCSYVTSFFVNDGKNVKLRKHEALVTTRSANSSGATLQGSFHQILFTQKAFTQFVRKIFQS